MRLPRRRHRSTARAVGLTRLEPVSRTFGFERGRPIDRWYIERFLAAHASDVRGRVLEVAESTYSQRYGGDGVERADVLHAAPGNPQATIVGDLTTGAGIPEAAFDCFVMTQTLPFIYEVADAVRGVHRLLKPGGIVLASVPGMSQVSREDQRDWGDWWRFTSQGARRLFGEVFGDDAVQVTAHGNVLAACAFLYGLAAEDLTQAQLAHHDPEYELLTTVRAVKRASGS
jgi:SAM-dependent methyltransferase